MINSQKAALAYASAAAQRSLRQQEAEIFLRVNAGLRRAKTTTSRITRVRALADNDRLWMMVIDVSRDPANALPAEIRANLVSVGRAVQREMQSEAPNIDFLLSVNENLAAGLLGPA